MWAVAETERENMHAGDCNDEETGWKKDYGVACENAESDGGFL